MSSVNGIAKFSSAGVVLEFESKLFGLISNGVKEARLALPDILDIKFRKGILKRGTKIEIRATSFIKLNEMPHNEGKVVLKLEAADFERGREAVERLQKEMAIRSGELPPTHTPLSVVFDESEDDTQELKK